MSTQTMISLLDNINEHVTLLKRERYLIQYSKFQIRVLHSCELSFSILSVLFGTIGVILWFRMDPTRRMIFRLQLLVLLILWDLLKAFCYLCFNALKLKNLNELLENQNGSMEYGFCDGWGFVVSFATYCSDFIMFVITVHNAWMIFYPKSSKVYKKKIILYKVFFGNIMDILKMKKFPTFKLLFNEVDHYNKRMIINEGGLYPYRWYIASFVFSSGIITSSLVFVDGGHFSANYTCSVPHLPVWKRLLSSWILKFTNLITIVLVYSSIILYISMKYESIKKEKKLLYGKSKIVVPSSSPQTYNRNGTINTTSNESHNGSPMGSSNNSDIELRTSVPIISENLQKELMDSTSSATDKRLKVAMRELKSLAVYPLGYVLVWVFPTISQIYNYVHDADRSKEIYAINVLISMALPLSCTIDTLIFLIREKPWSVTTKKLAKYGSSFIRDDEGYMENEAPTFGDDLLNEIRIEDFHTDGDTFVSNAQNYSTIRNNSVGSVNTNQPSSLSSFRNSPHQIFKSSFGNKRRDSNFSNQSSLIVKKSSNNYSRKSSNGLNQYTGITVTNQIAQIDQDGNFLKSDEIYEDPLNIGSDDEIDFLEILRRGPTNTL